MCVYILLPSKYFFGSGQKFFTAENNFVCHAYTRMHLSSSTGWMIMTFYSLLTFFVAPLLVAPHLPRWVKDKCLVGFTVGFIISAALWHFFGRHMV